MIYLLLTIIIFTVKYYLQILFYNYILHFYPGSHNNGLEYNLYKIDCRK